MIRDDIKKINKKIKELEESNLLNNEEKNKEIERLRKEIQEKIAKEKEKYESYMKIQENMRKTIERNMNEIIDYQKHIENLNKDKQYLENKIRELSFEIEMNKKKFIRKRARNISKRKNMINKINKTNKFTKEIKNLKEILPKDILNKDIINNINNINNNETSEIDNKLLSDIMIEKIRKKRKEDTLNEYYNSDLIDLYRNDTNNPLINLKNEEIQKYNESILNNFIEA